MHTSLRIHANGWNSVYHAEHLATGLSPGDLGAYWKQRMRWAVGNLSVMWHDNPLFKGGLSLAQRLSYLGSVWAWTVGPQKLIYYFTPPLMLLTGLYPIANFDLKLLGIYLLNLIVSLTVFKLISRGYAKIIRGELYSMVNAFMLTTAMVRAALRLGVARFVVTRKGGRSERVLAYVLPQVGLLVITYWCAVWAFLRYHHNMALDMTLTIVAGVWCVFNAVLALLAISVAHRRVDIREKFRFHQRLPVLYDVSVPEGEVMRGLGTTLDLHDRGMALRTLERLPVGSHISLAIYLPVGEQVKARGRLLHQRPSEDPMGVYEYGIRFSRLPPEEHVKLDRFLTQFVIPATFRFLTRGPASMKRRLARWFGARALRRRFPRRGIQLPIAFRLGANPVEDDWYITDDLSEGGLAVTLSQRETLSRDTDFTILAPGGPIQGRARFVREEEAHLPQGIFFKYGLQFVYVQPEDRPRIEQLRRYAVEEEVAT